MLLLLTNLAGLRLFILLLISQVLDDVDIDAGCVWDHAADDCLDDVYGVRLRAFSGVVGVWLLLD